jgi:hypothetical protein
MKKKKILIEKKNLAKKIVVVSFSFLPSSPSVGPQIGGH